MMKGNEYFSVEVELGVGYEMGFELASIGQSGIQIICEWSFKRSDFQASTPCALLSCRSILTTKVPIVFLVKKSVSFNRSERVWVLERYLYFVGERK